MAKKVSKTKVAKRFKLDDHMAVETGLVYWLEHVVHWYALLAAVVAVLAVGYALFGGPSVNAGS
jgi:hypothetical protein